MLLTSQQIEFYRDNGYVRLESLAAADEINRMIETYDQLFADRVGRDVGDQFDLAGTDDDDGTALLPQLMNPAKYAPELLGAAFRRAGFSIAQQLLGDAVEPGDEHAICKPARDGAETPWHQDEAYWDPEFEYEALSIWMPLQEATLANGCLQFIPGSHLKGIAPHRSIGGDPRVHGLEVESLDASTAVACPLPAGGCTIHHCRTLHYAGSNRTSKPRRAYIMTFRLPPTQRSQQRQFPWLAQKARGPTTAGGGEVSTTPATSKQIVLDALAGQDVPRTPVGPLAVHYCAGAAGVPIRQYTLDSHVLADCVVQYYRRFQPDAIWLSADTWVTAEAMGASVGFPGEGQPAAGIGAPVIRSLADVDRMPPPAPSTQGRWPLMLDALRRIRAAVGPDVFIVACFDQYPFSLACALMGIQSVMTGLIDDRSLVETVMERGIEYAAAYAQSLAAAGADMLSGGDSPAGLIGPQLYREVVLPVEQRLISQLQSTCHLPVSLHICGDSTPILADMAASGADALELDHQVNIATACRLVGPGTTIWGNLDPVSVLAQGSVDDVRRATSDLLDAVRACDHKRFVLSSGCTLAWETPSENLMAMFEAARTADSRTAS